MTGIVFTDKAAQHYAQAINAFAPEIPLWSLGDAQSVNADVAISWLPPQGAYGGLPKLRLIHSIGAGVNHIISETSGAHVPVCRIVDPEQARIMAQYVLWGVLHFHRGFDRMMRAQQERRWLKFEHRPAERTTVGIMGMGVMGQTVAKSIAQLGFDVRGWSRAGRDYEGIRVHGEDEFDRFLSGLDMLICLLPLTSATRGILSTKLFSRLNRGATLIHVGRGDHLVTNELHAALDDGQLGGALIDVFPLEPLPSADPLWTSDKVIVTPHIAAISSSETVAMQILSNVRSLRDGAQLDYQIGRRTRFTENLRRQKHSTAGVVLTSERVKADPTVSKALCVRAGTLVYQIETRHDSDGVPLTYARNWFPAARFVDLPAIIDAKGGVSAALAEFGVNDYMRKWSRIGSVLPSSDVARRLQINRQQPVLWVENVDVDEQGVPIKYGVTHFAADRVQLMVEHDL